MIKRAINMKPHTQMIQFLLTPNVNKYTHIQSRKQMLILKVEHARVCPILSTYVVNQHEQHRTQSDIEFLNGSLERERQGN